MMKAKLTGINARKWWNPTGVHIGLYLDFEVIDGGDKFDKRLCFPIPQRMFEGLEDCEITIDASILEPEGEAKNDRQTY